MGRLSRSRAGVLFDWWLNRCSICTSLPKDSATLDRSCLIELYLPSVECSYFPRRKPWIWKHFETTSRKVKVLCRIFFRQVQHSSKHGRCWLFRFRPYVFVSRTILEKGVLVLKKKLVNTKWNVTTQSQTEHDVQNYRKCLLIVCLLPCHWCSPVHVLKSRLHGLLHAVRGPHEPCALKICCHKRRRRICKKDCCPKPLCIRGKKFVKQKCCNLHCCKFFKKSLRQFKPFLILMGRIIV